MNKVTGDDENEEKQRHESKSEYAQAFEIFKDDRPPEDVAIELDIETPTVICYYEDCLKLLNMQKLVTIYNETKDDQPLFLHLYRRIKKERLGKHQISELLKMPNLILDLKKKVDLYNDHILDLHSKKVKLKKEK